MFRQKKVKKISVTTTHYKGPEQRQKGSNRRIGKERRNFLRRREKPERLLLKRDIGFGKTISGKFWLEMQELKKTPGKERKLFTTKKRGDYVVFRDGNFYIFTDRRFQGKRREKERRSNKGKKTKVIKKGK